MKNKFLQPRPHFLSDTCYIAMRQSCDGFEKDCTTLGAMTVIQSGQGITINVVFSQGHGSFTDKQLNEISSKFTPLLQKYHMLCKKCYCRGERVDYYAKPDWNYWISKNGEYNVQS